MTPICQYWTDRDTIVVGLGNTLLGDDGVGQRAMRCARTLWQGDTRTRFEEDSYGGLRLMERLVGYRRAIIVDAIVSAEKAGTVLELSLSDLPTAHSGSSHDADLPTALAIGRHAGAALPDDERIVLVASEAADIHTFSLSCTQDVEAAIPLATTMILKCLARMENSRGLQRSDVAIATKEP